MGKQDSFLLQLTILRDSSNFYLRFLIHLLYGCDIWKNNLSHTNQRRDQCKPMKQILLFSTTVSPSIRLLLANTRCTSHLYSRCMCLAQTICSNPSFVECNPFFIFYFFHSVWANTGLSVTAQLGVKWIEKCLLREEMTERE